MTNEKEQTAVEWLIQKLINKQNGVFDGLPILSVDEIYDKAKEKEKRQHWATWGNGVANAENEKLFKDYWNDTYGGNK